MPPAAPGVEAVVAGLEQAQASAKAASAAGERDRKTFMGRRTFPAMDLVAQAGKPATPLRSSRGTADAGATRGSDRLERQREVRQPQVEPLEFAPARADQGLRRR